MVQNDRGKRNIDMLICWDSGAGVSMMWYKKDIDGLAFTPERENTIHAGDGSYVVNKSIELNFEETFGTHACVFGLCVLVYLFIRVCTYFKRILNSYVYVCTVLYVEYVARVFSFYCGSLCVRVGVLPNYRIYRINVLISDEPIGKFPMHWSVWLCDSDDVQRPTTHPTETARIKPGALWEPVKRPGDSALGPNRMEFNVLLGADIMQKYHIVAVPDRHSIAHLPEGSSTAYFAKRVLQKDLLRELLQQQQRVCVVSNKEVASCEIPRF